MGPLNGAPEMASAAETPSMAGTSGFTAGFSDLTVAMTCTSRPKPLANSGRMGRSISREVRISPSLGRPSRRKKPPGMRPAA
jgi:hypothetical protein